MRIIGACGVDNNVVSGMEEWKESVSQPYGTEAKLKTTLTITIVGEKTIHFEGCLRDVSSSYVIRRSTRTSIIVDLETRVAVAVYFRSTVVVWFIRGS